MGGVEGRELCIGRSFDAGRRDRILVPTPVWHRGPAGSVRRAIGSDLPGMAWAGSTGKAVRASFAFNTNPSPIY